MTQQSLLVVEDSDEDMAALTRTLRRVGFSRPVQRCEVAERALEYLGRMAGQGAEASPIWPGLILLDLNLPGTDGRDLLREIKDDERLRDIPVVIFSSSTNPRDIELCYRYGANSFLVKPMDLKELERSVRLLLQYWFDLNVLPTSVTKRA